MDRPIKLEPQSSEPPKPGNRGEAELEMYLDFYECAPIAYYSYDRNGVILSANQSGAALLGVERSRVIGTRFGRYLTAAARIVFADFLSGVFGSSVMERVELTLAKHGLTPLLLRMEGKAAESGLSCRVAVVDVTELRHAQECNIRLNREMEQRVQERTAQLEAVIAALQASCNQLQAFSYTVAHDLRTPLRSMCGFSSILLADYADRLDGTGKEALQRIGAAAERMGHMVDGILELFELKSSELRRQDVDLSLLARETIEVFNELEPGRKVEVTVAGGICGYGDPHLLRQVLENLLGNAWKYTCKTSCPRIEFGSASNKGEPVYYVRDNGVGFDMNHLANLFAPFERLHGSRDIKGTGIGLATVQRIITRHGGRIWAVGEPGKGATFYFSLGATPDRPKCLPTDRDKPLPEPAWGKPLPEPAWGKPESPRAAHAEDPHAFTIRLGSNVLMRPRRK